MRCDYQQKLARKNSKLLYLQVTNEIKSFRLDSIFKAYLSHNLIELDQYYIYNSFNKKSDWLFHYFNYRKEVIKEGISILEYSNRYHLNLRRCYSNFRKIGGSSISILYWVYHRRNFHQHKPKLSVKEYIEKHKLEQKTAFRQLQRKPMSEFWSHHFDNYYQNFWVQGYNVSEYTKIYGLSATTARQYLFNFPKKLFNPKVIKPWL